MLKTRIIKHTYGDGHSYFQPQYKRGWFWKDFHKYSYFDGSIPVELDTLVEAQKFLDKEIVIYNQHLLISKEIIKYP